MWNPFFPDSTFYFLQVRVLLICKHGILNVNELRLQTSILTKQYGLMQSLLDISILLSKKNYMGEIYFNKHLFS